MTSVKFVFAMSLGLSVVFGFGCKRWCETFSDCPFAMDCVDNTCVWSGSETCTYNGETFVVGDSFPALDGCNTCYCDQGGMVGCTEMACLREECTSDECGPQPMAPNLVCSDGSMSGPGDCVRSEDSTCAWEWLECPEYAPCGGFAGFACPYQEQTCVDDLSDDCDPQNGGADCMGICVPSL